MPKDPIRRTWRQQPLVTVLAGLALVTIVSITVLSGMPERIAGGARIGNVLYDLSMAYLGAWVFNLLVVVIPRLRTEEQVLTELRNPIQGITGAGASLMYELALRAAEANPGGAVQPFPDPLPSLTEEQICEVCAAVDISATWPRFLTSADRPQQAWAEYLASDGMRIQGFIQRVQPAYPLLDSELVAAIQAVANSSYLLQVPRLPRIPMNNDNLEFLAPDIFEIRNRCDRLTVYFDERIRPLTEHHRT